MRTSIMAWDGRNAVYEHRARYSDGRDTDRAAVERGIDDRAKRMVAAQDPDGSRHAAVHYRNVADGELGWPRP